MLCSFSGFLNTLLSDYLLTIISASCTLLIITVMTLEIFQPCNCFTLKLQKPCGYTIYFIIYHFEFIFKYNCYILIVYYTHKLNISCITILYNIYLYNIKQCIIYNFILKCIYETCIYIFTHAI